MKKSALAISIFAASVVCASAADMAPRYTKAPVGAAVPVYDWTGFYVGGNVGYGWSDVRVVNSPNDPALTAITGLLQGSTTPGTPLTPVLFHRDGLIGGIQGGYNRQFNSNWLLGLEADFQLGDMRGNGTSSPFLFAQGSTPVPVSIQELQSIKWFGTVRGRLGWLPTNNWMIYATGGFAYAQVEANTTLNAASFVGITSVTTVPGPPDIGFLCVTGPNCFTGHFSRTTPGWTIGAGTEYKLSQNVSIKAEYLYMNFGDVNLVGTAQVSAIPFCPGCSGARSSYTGKSNNDFNVARVGVNWNFSQGN